MESFGALKNNAFGDFNKEDILGYLDEMKNKSKKAELVLGDRVIALGKDREHLIVKINAFEKVILELEKHLDDEREHVRLALMERDELSKKINVNRDVLDSILAKKQQDLAESEQEILQFIEQKQRMDQRLKEMESKSRHYDDIKANVNAIRLETEMEAVKTTEQEQEQAMEAVLLIENMSHELESMKKQLNAAAGGLPESTPPSPVYDMTASTGIAYPPIPDLTLSGTTITEEQDFPVKSPLPEHEPQTADGDLMNRLDALYRALDQSVEKLQNIRTEFVPQNQGSESSDNETTSS